MLKHKMPKLRAITEQKKNWRRTEEIKTPIQWKISETQRTRRSLSIDRLVYLGQFTLLECSFCMCVESMDAYKFTRSICILTFAVRISGWMLMVSAGQDRVQNNNSRSDSVPGTQDLKAAEDSLAYPIETWFRPDFRTWIFVLFRWPLSQLVIWIRSLAR